MSDILILFPPDKKVAAQQIAEALAAAGFSGQLTPLGTGGGEAALGAARGGGAAILIWSRALAASADLEGWLRPLRQSPDVVEVSTDGIAPLEGDESRVVLLSGWRGQPFHLGWQRIVAKLEASGAAQRGAPAPVATPGGAADTRAQPQPSVPREGTTRRRFAIPAIAAAGLLAVVGAAAWIGDGPRQAAEPGGPAAPAEAAAPAPEPLPGPVLQPAGAVMDGDTAPQGNEVVAATAATPADPPRTSTSAKVATTERSRTAPAQAAKARAVPVPPVVKRYSKKRSKVMRKFCERSGRNTLECRIFARSTRAAGR
ncbi:MAG TPA: hypothetical protein VF680_15755 [Allosphingosinicella sp.]